MDKDRSGPATLVKLRAALERAVADQSMQIVTIDGGAGESAVERFAASEGDALVLRGRFSRFTPSLGLGPLPEIVDGLVADRPLESLVPADAPWALAALRDVLGHEDAPARELGEIYSAVAHLIAARRGRPVVMVLYEIEHAGHGFLNLIQYLRARRAPLLVVYTAAAPDAPEPDVAELIAMGAGDTRPELVGALLERAGETAEAASYLARAGLQSLQRSDMPSAADLLTRAAGLHAPGNGERLSLLTRSCDAFLAIGHVERAAQIARAGLAEARAHGDECAAVRLDLWDTMLSGTGASLSVLEDKLGAAAGVLERCGDSVGMAQVAETRAHVSWDAGDPAASTARMEEALRHARAGGDRPTTARIVVWLLTHLLWGPVPADGAIERCNALEWTREWSALVEVKRLIVLAALTAATGKQDAARSLVARARELQADLGQPPWVARVPQLSAWIELTAGAAAAAEHELVATFEELRTHGHPAAIEAGLLLARALSEQGRFDEARAVADACEQMTGIGPEDDLDPGRGELGAVRARARALLAEPAVDVAAVLVELPPAFRPLQRADSLMDLAGAAGDRLQARQLIEEAVRLYESKQAPVCVTRARKALADLGL